MVCIANGRHENPCFHFSHILAGTIFDVLMEHLLLKTRIDEEGRGSRVYETGDGGRGDTSINIECLPLVEHPVLLLMISQKE